MNDSATRPVRLPRSSPRFSLSKKPPRLIPPFPKAPDWMCNPYYYWWEFLRRNDEYARYCNAGGGLRGPLAQFYADWGDVRQSDFKTWWAQRGQSLFAEIDPPCVAVVKAGDYVNTSEYLTVRLPLNRPTTKTLKDVRELLGPAKRRLEQHQELKVQYIVAGKPVLAPLHKYLQVYDARQRLPDATLVEIADAARLTIDVVKPEKRGPLSKADIELLKAEWERDLRKRKTQIANRYLRTAKRLIDGAVNNKWPVFR